MSFPIANVIYSVRVLVISSLANTALVSAAVISWIYMYD